MTHFDVLTQPWIPVERITGEMTEVGLRDALVHAHDYRQVILDSPLEEYAVQRLMIAFLMDALQLEGVSNRRALFNAGHFEADSIDQYVATCKPGCF
ncbi:MAG: type I-E CRISPR-associated protein Cse1/CasA, partial [Clostridia bacterium]